MDASRHNRRATLFGGLPRWQLGWFLCSLMFLASTGCGTTRWTDSTRTATEQLLITDAIDEAVGQLNLEVLADREVFFDPQYLNGTVDENYMISSLRQHLLASGCILKEIREDATIVVEARSGAVGTDRHDVMIGVPSVNVPSFLPTPVALPSTIPEIPLAKNTKQRGVVKLAVFAYNRKTGRRVWQSGIEPVTSFAKDSWVLGAGPFRKSTIKDGSSFVGDVIPLIGNKDGDGKKDDHEDARVALTKERIFQERLAPPEAVSDAQLATHTSDVPAVSQSPPAVNETSPVAELATAPSDTPAMLPHNEVIAPIASVDLLRQTVAPSMAANASAVPRFAPRPNVQNNVPDEVPAIVDVPAAKHDREVAETKSPLQRLWPTNWFKRNGGQGAD